MTRNLEISADHLHFISLSLSLSRAVMSAPNLLRVGAAEYIFVEIQGIQFMHEENIHVQITVLNHPTKTKRLVSEAAVLNRANKFQELVQIMIPVKEFSKDPNKKQYVYLQAYFPDRTLEKVVLVKFHSAFIFIQTDKTLYTPNSKVYFRMFAVPPNTERVEMDDQTYNYLTESVAIDIVVLYFIMILNYNPGLWKVVAKFPNNPQQIFAAEFEVKAHVLPSFEVKLTPETSFFFVDKPDLTVHIKARYLLGESVDGVAIVLFGVLHNGQKKSIQRSLQNVPIAGGEGTVRLQREHITQTFGNIQNLVGSSIFVAVTVLTDQGKKKETVCVCIYALNKPKPAQNLKVNVDTGHGAQMVVRTGSNGKAKFPINTVARTNSLTITAKTEDRTFPHERQASATMVVHPYISKSNSYIHIDVNTDELELGANLRISCFNNRQQHIKNDLTYLITSGGQLVKYGRHETRCLEVISMILPITKEMLPSFRIIVYYHTNENEVVSDSVQVDVKDSCLGSLRLEQAGSVPSYLPHRLFRLNIIGDPEAMVGIVAVDKGVFGLNNKHRLTQKKVWDIVKKHDTGCTPGGGRDSMSVFYDAGLLFVSSVSHTPIRKGDTKGILTLYLILILQKLYGIRTIALQLHCCCWLASLQFEKHEFCTCDNTYLDRNEIVIRTVLPESWLWSDMKLPSCPKNNPNCDTTSVMKYLVLRDSITTWQIIGISLSRTHGICVADPLEVIVRKDFFIDLRLPDTAVHEEQLEIKAILHNYSPEPITVRVDLIETDGICSSAFNRGEYIQEVKVEAQATRSVPFVIVPMKEKELLIEVKAAVRGSLLNDGVMKGLQSVAAEYNFFYCCLTRQLFLPLDGYQEQIINSEIPHNDVVPNTPGVTVIYLTGDTSASVENVISGNSMGTLIYQPSGSVEQNIIHMSLMVIATTYLDKTHQWENVGFEKRNEALRYIKIGYMNELAYSKADGSFALVPNKQSSTWLTAFVAKVFAMARNLVSIETAVICNAMNFLILRAQRPDGKFTEVGTMHQGGITGDVYGTDSAESMTAFCLIAMQESRLCCAASVNLLQGSIEKAVAYLERRLPYLTNPYAAAVTSYALATENKLDWGILFKFASPGSDHWPVPKGHVYTLEATAYALLALVQAEAFEEARPVVRWLRQQQRVSGSYQSTQATIMVYQAVAEYWARAREVDHELEVSVFFPGRPRANEYRFDKINNSTRKSKVRPQTHKTRTYAMLCCVCMETLYYARPRVQERDCQRFNLSVQLLQGDFVTYLICSVDFLYRYKNEERDSTMAVLDIGLLPGFTVNTDDLNLLSKRGASVYPLSLSDRGSLIIYLNKVSHTRPEEIMFRIHQKQTVGVLQPAAVSVYEYHESEPCVKFYHPERTNGQLLRHCTNDRCTCAEEDCCMRKRGRISPDERINKSCEISQTGKTDFVYKVSFEEFTDGLSTDIYTMRVVKVIKEGSYDNPEGGLRKFISFPHCRESLALERGKTYLIMGTSKDIFRDELCQYALGERNWVEYWPTPAECQTDDHRHTCIGLDRMVMQYEFFGCLQCQ
uniref:NTR domain-containing protein n=1 Tax=Mola mola TaxID=94237 RepID=A0A3Q3XMB4_MOLML